MGGKVSRESENSGDGGLWYPGEGSLVLGREMELVRSFNPEESTNLRT